MSHKITFKQAAQRILEASGEPLSASEITKRAIEQGLINTSGKTPDATMAAQIYVDMKSGDSSVFKKVGRGLFTVKVQAEISQSPRVIIENQNDIVRNKLKDRLLQMDPFQFEFLVADLLHNIGYENVNVTKRSGDNGIDIIANLTVGGITNVKTVIQAKRNAVTNKVSGNVITQLRGSAEVDQRGLVITTSSFTPAALEESKAQNKMPVALMNGDKLVDLLIKYDVGIRKQELIALQIDEEYFDNYTTDRPEQSDLEKNRSLWPLPGGNNHYVTTLNLFLKEISDQRNTKSELITWYMTAFDNVKSESTSQGYINVPKSMGLTVLVNGRYELTNDGKLYVREYKLSKLYDILAKNILAFDDVFEFIKISENSVNEEMVLDYLKENFDINWSTFAQVRYRLLWLVNLGKIEKVDNIYKVIDMSSSPTRNT